MNDGREIGAWGPAIDWNHLPRFLAAALTARSVRGPGPQCGHIDLVTPSLKTRSPITTNNRNAKLMTNTTAPTVAHNILSPPPFATSRIVDLTRGASRLGIRARVLIESKILADYGEIDNALGHNTAGLVLSVLSHCLATGHAGLAEDLLTVGLVRRQDGALVELDLSLRRTRAGDQECFTLRLADEREAEA